MIRNTIVVNGINKSSGGHVPYLYTTITSASFTMVGGTEVFTVAVADPTQVWSTDKNIPWVTVIGTLVGTDPNVAIVCDESPYIITRSGIVTISSQYCANILITITQQGTPL
jgi:hypothetical protein